MTDSDDRGGSPRLALVLVVAVGVAGATGGGATGALLTDAAATDAATITLAKDNAGAVSFSKCKQLSFEPADPADFRLLVGTTGGTYAFGPADFTNNYQVKTGKEVPRGERIRNATLDGTTFRNPNFDGGC